MKSIKSMPAIAAGFIIISFAFYAPPVSAQTSVFDARQVRGIDEPEVRLMLNGRVEIRGAILNSISAASRVLTVSVLGVQVTVDAANALILDRDEQPIIFGDLLAGDELRIEGTANVTSVGAPTVVFASRIMDRSIELAEIAPVFPNNNAAMEQRIRELQEIVERLRQEIARPGQPVDVAPPVISSVAAVEIEPTEATIVWTTDEPATSRVFFSTGAPVNPATARVETSGGLTVNHRVSLDDPGQLAPNTTFFFIVESVDAAGNVSRSVQFSFTTSASAPPPAGDTIAPVISGVSVSGVTSSSASIAWATNEPATSKLFISTNTPVNPATASVVSRTALVTNHSIPFLTGLTSNTTFFFVVESVDAAGNVSRTNEFTFTTSSSIDAAAPATALSTPFAAPSPQLSPLISPPATTTPVTASSPATTSVTPGAATPVTSAPVTTTDVAPLIISTISVSGIGPGLTTISWTTNEPSTGRVFFGASSPVNLSTTQFLLHNILSASHSMTVVSTPGTAQFFVIEARDAAGNTAVSTERVFTAF